LKGHVGELLLGLGERLRRLLQSVRSLGEWFGREREERARGG
jgi:hypothetical protein